MRRATLNKSKAKLKDRSRDDLPAATTATVAVAASSVTAVEALSWDEGFQAQNHELLNPSVPVPIQTPAVPPAPVSASISVTAHDAVPGPDPDLLSQLDHGRQLLHPVADSSHATVSSSVLDAPMTDAFPAELDAVSATVAATIATNISPSAIATSGPPTHLAPSTATHLPRQDSDHSNDHFTATISNTYANTSRSVESDDDDDIDLELDASFRPPILDDLNIPTTNPNLDPDYVHHYHAGDYDLDMSDSDGGASLDDDVLYVPQLQVDHHSHPAQPQEDDDAQAPSSGPVNHLLQTFFNVPSLAGTDTDTAMDVGPPPGPWAPTPNNAPLPLPQPPTLIEPFGLNPISNPNPTMLGSENHGLVDFLWHWSHEARMAHSYTLRARAPCPEEIRRQAQIHMSEVRYDELEGDECDLQGMDWTSMGTTREHARQWRLDTYKNYVNKEGSDLLNVSGPSAPNSSSWTGKLMRMIGSHDGCERPLHG